MRIPDPQILDNKEFPECHKGPKYLLKIAIDFNCCLQRRTSAFIHYEKIVHTTTTNKANGR
jgi:hypothetical protein